MVGDGDKVGSYNQGLGLAQALGLPTELKKVYPRFPWKYLPSSLWICPLASQSARGGKLAPPWPDVVISIGRASAAPTAALRKRSRCFAICLMNPRMSFDNYDIVIAPEHDRLVGPNVLNIRGALHMLTDAGLKEAAANIAPLLKDLPRPYHTVLLGGHNVHGRYTSEFMEDIVANLTAILRHYGGTLLITPSRRTPEDLVKLIHNKLFGLSYVLRGADREFNPYQGFLGVADAIFVVGDSISMSGEACFTGKPVFIIEPPFIKDNKKFTAFLNSLYQHHHAKIFSPHHLPQLNYTAPKLDAMGDVVPVVMQLLVKHQKTINTTYSSP